MSGDWGFGTLLKIFIWGYLVGGLTLIPAVLALAWFLGTTPVDIERIGDDQHGVEGHCESHGSANEKDKDNEGLGVGLDESILGKLKGKTHVPDVCAGYFAVCREYVPGGVNGKAPDRTTPAGAVVSMESPSVYQSMYRSIFDRNKTTSPSIEAPNVWSKKARNVFYVVLRLGHLMLYDNEDQIEVRHVISLAHYKVDVHGGGDRIPEGELWIKRNCIRLVQQVDSNSYTEAKSFYLFSDNCSEKEDFYHAMLQAQEHHKGDATAESNPIPLKFDTPDLVKLVQQLHASEENLHTRWINALIGRLFLAMYKTSQIKDAIAAKINKKIARVPKPAIISSVHLRKVDMGTLPPFITNPKLKELTVDGDLVVEADVSYKGNFRLEISAIVRIELGTRFKAREVTLVLATVLKKLEGHLLIRIKPPPSNRLWITFETPPKIELSLEPIVSSRQITYGVVLRAIESRIREVVNETLVLPNWDDIPFSDTIAQEIRGGIWHEDQKDHVYAGLPSIKTDDTTLETAIGDAELLDEAADAASTHFSIPSSIDSEDLGAAFSSSTEYKTPNAKPRPLRSNSSTAQSKVDLANASAEIFHDRNNFAPTSVKSLPISTPMRTTMRTKKPGQQAECSGSSSEDVSTASISGASTKSAPIPGIDRGHTRERSRDLTAQEIASAAAAAAGATNMSKKQTLGQNLGSATAAARHWLASKQSPQPSRTNNPTGSSNSLINNRPRSSGGPDVDGDASLDTRPHLQSQPSTSKPHTEPMGRGQPLPPPGTPLPLPQSTKRQTWAPAAVAAASTFANLAKRKPHSASPGLAHKKSHEQLDLSTPPSSASLLQPPILTPQFEVQEAHHHPTRDSEELFRRRSSNADLSDTRRRKSSAASSTSSQQQQPPPLPKRRQRQPSLTQNSYNNRASQGVVDHELGEGLLVVEAPLAERSAPPSPRSFDGSRSRS